mgnify:CR=1 FL=1
MDPLDSEDDHLDQMLLLKTPTRNIHIKCTRKSSLLYFKVHLLKKMRSNFISIDDQMMCRADVPRLVETCTSHIERYGLRLSGLYRISGLASRIKQLEASYEESPLSFEIDAEKYKVHDVTVLLKTFFRKLKMPLFAPNDRWLEIHEMIGVGKMIQAADSATGIIGGYSKVSQATIHHLLRHLNLITLLQKDNQMGAEQIGRVFGTNLFGFDNWGCLNQVCKVCELFDLLLNSLKLFELFFELILNSF